MSEELIRQIVRESLLLERQASTTPGGTEEDRAFVVTALLDADPSLVQQKSQKRSTIASSSVRIIGTEEAIRSAIDRSSSLRFVREYDVGEIKSLTGTYTTFEVSGVGGGPKIYYIIAVTAAKKDDPNLLPGQMLSIMAEYATIEGINDLELLPAALEDKWVKPKYEALDADGQKMANQIYAAMVNAASSARTKIPSGSAVAGNATSGGNGGSTTAAVDVMIKSATGETVADVHVKFNDDDRIIGLQMEPHEKVIMDVKKLELIEPDPNWPFAAKYRHLREKFIANVLLPQYDIEPIPGMSTVQAAKGGLELNMFQNPELREKWLNYADGKTVINKAGAAVSAPSGHEPLKEMIKKRVARFLSEKNLDKSIYFFNFESSPSKPRSTGPVTISLTVKEITGLSDKITVVEDRDDLTTFPYIVMYDDEPVFRVETRTRGTQNHPPQLKGNIPASVIKRIKDVTASVAEELPGGAEASFDVDETKVKTILAGMTEDIGTFEGGVIPATKQSIEETLLREFIFLAHTNDYDISNFLERNRI